MVYEKYQEGISVEDIVFYISVFTEYEGIDQRDVEEVIDFMNRFV